MNATQQRPGQKDQKFESKRIDPKDLVVTHKPSSAYPFRTAIAVFLLLINLIVAAIYLHIINP